MTTAFWFWTIGGALYCLKSLQWNGKAIFTPEACELGKWSFIVGLAMWFLGH